MKVIIVSAGPAQPLVLSWWLTPCLDRLQMKTINPCRSPVIMCYFLNTLPPPPAQQLRDFISILTRYFGCNETLKAHPIDSQDLLKWSLELKIIPTVPGSKHKNLQSIRQGKGPPSYNWHNKTKWWQIRGENCYKEWVRQTSQFRPTSPSYNKPISVCSTWPALFDDIWHFGVLAFFCWWLAIVTHWTL